MGSGIAVPHRAGHPANATPMSATAGTRNLRIEQGRRFSPSSRRPDPPATDALLGVRVKIGDNYFLIGLNREAADLTRNIQEIGERGWFDIPMQLDDVHIARLTFEKGADGDKIVSQALAAWSSSPDANLPASNSTSSSLGSISTPSNHAEIVPTRAGGNFHVRVLVNKKIGPGFYDRQRGKRCKNTVRCRFDAASHLYAYQVLRANLSPA